MIERRSQISELYDLKHRNDEDPNESFDYESNFIDKVLPQYGRKNDNFYQFTKKLQDLMVWGIETNLIIRNWYNWTVSKYYKKHSN